MNLQSPHPQARRRRFGRAIPDAAPAAVLDAIDVAADAWEQLEASGRHVHFDLHPVTGRLTIALENLDGTPLQALSPSAVLELASGATIG